MKSTLLVLSLALVATACSSKNESRTCYYNNVQIDCAEFDNIKKPTAPAQPPAPKQPTSPTRDLPPQPPKLGSAQNFTDCMDAAEEAGLYRDQVALVCAKPTEFSAACLKAADKAGLTREQMSSVCFESKETSASCIEEADERGLLPADTVNQCR